MRGRDEEVFDDVIGAGLPVGGAEGGTLADAFVTGEPLNGLVRAKTGTLYNYADGIDGNEAATTVAASNAAEAAPSECA